MHDVLEEVRNGAHWFDVLIDCNNFGALDIAPSGKQMNVSRKEG